MQNAEAVVDILRARGRRGLPCDELYRQLFNPALFLMSWGRIYANDGAMTPGARRGWHQARYPAGYAAPPAGEPGWRRWFPAAFRPPAFAS
jgi:hypothetical protein